jgi:UDP-GlcNAc:undecaprenyl-phosphate GlcNAc-1-phosphate transferase
LFTITYKKRLLEVILDFFLIAFAYYLAFALRFDFVSSTAYLDLFLISLPLVVIGTYASFFLFGIYRGVWRYTDLEDLVRLAIAVVGGTLLALALVVLLYRFVGYPRGVFVLYTMLLFLGMAGSRLSFRFFGLLVTGAQTQKVPVLIYGAGDAGEVVVRECRKNPRVGYRPIGFLDDDPRKEGRAVLGLPIFGGADKLPQVLRREKVQGCIISSPSIMENGHGEQIRSLCQQQGVFIKQLRLEFVEDGVVGSV